MGQYSHVKTSNLEARLQNAEECMQKIIFMDNNYVPMSSQIKDTNISESDDTEHLRENDYVIMR